MKRILLGVLTAVAVCSSAQTLENDSLAILFRGPSSGFAVTGIVNKASGGGRFVSASGKSADFWELQFVGGGKPGQIATLQNHNPSRRSLRRRADGGATFVWEGLDLPDAKGAVDVYATVSFDSDGASRWTLSVTNRAENGWALSTVSYPYLRSVLPNGEGDALVPTKDLGARLIRKFEPSKLMPSSYGYPGWYPMVTAFWRGSSGMYMAAHDRESRIKSLCYDKDGTVRFETLVENAGVAGKAADGPRYPVVIASCGGDWWEVARRYRKFALTCPWTAKGPIAKRKDFPKAMAEINTWCTLGGPIYAATNRTAQARDRWPDLKIGLHWYSWQLQPDPGGDATYPEFLPRSGVIDHLARCREQGMVTMPYVNGRLWDITLSSFPYARPYACMKPDGNPQVENYYKGTAVMCPACPIWQDTLLAIGTNVVEGLGTTAIYYDQVTCARPMPCHNASHGHATGGGTYWADGYHQAFARIHDRLAPMNVPITSEGAAESWMDVVDGHLICGRVASPDDVPFLPAVYSGYTVYFGMVNTAKMNPASFYASLARATLWGCTGGRWNFTNFFRPKMNTKRQDILDGYRCADYIGALARVRTAAADFLVFGHLEDELRPLDPVSTVGLVWYPPQKPRPGKPPLPPEMVDWAAVVGAVWRDVDDTRLAVFAANISSERQTVRFRMPPGCGAPQVFPLPGQPSPDLAVADGVVTLTLAPTSFVGVTAPRH